MKNAFGAEETVAAAPINQPLYGVNRLSLDFRAVSQEIVI